MTLDREQLAYRQAELYAQELRELYERDRHGAKAIGERREKAAAVRGVLERGVRMVFQPIIDLRDDREAGMEALARFDGDPPKGPDVWFREAAEVGLGTELELLAIRAAVDAAHAQLPADSFLAVNLSPATAMSSGFVEIVEGIDRIVIEITEHAPVADYDRLAHRLRPFRAAGGRLAVDDAGAGFASLQHILALQPDIIKLDISLTRHVDSDRARRALAKALITFAEEIEISIVAEGIETEAEMETLKALGVTYGQGYFLGRPGSLPEVMSPA